MSIFFYFLAPPFSSFLLDKRFLDSSSDVLETGASDQQELKLAGYTSPGISCGSDVIGLSGCQFVRDLVKSIRWFHT